MTNVINHNEKSEDIEYDIIITLGNDSIDVINNYELKEKVTTTNSSTINNSLNN